MRWNCFYKQYRYLTFAMFCGGFILTSCQLFGLKTQSSEVVHSTEALARSDVTWQWISTDDHSAVLATMGYSTDDHDIGPAQTLLQEWLDVLVTQARKIGIDTVSAIPDTMPNPRVVILKNGPAGAWVLPANLCLEGPIGSDQMTEGITYDPLRRRFSIDTTEPTCSQRMPLDSQRFVAWFNDKGLPCQLVASNNKILQFSNQCFGEDQAHTNNIAASLLRLPSTAPFIFISQTMLKELTAEQVVAVFAHELGHYFRSHITNGDNGYDYFYRHTSSANKGKPPADPTLTDLGERLRVISQELSPYRAPQEHLDSRLFWAAQSLVRDFTKSCSTESCTLLCALKPWKLFANGSLVWRSVVVKLHSR